MDEGEKMILEKINLEIQQMNKNILYLCSRTGSQDQQLKNIEKSLELNCEEIAIYKKRLNLLEGKLMGGSAIIAIGISYLMSILI